MYSFLDTNGTLENESRVLNYRSDIVEKVKKRIGKEVDALELFDYIYGMLNSPIYINKYQEFLKVDFPRVQYPKDFNEFTQISEIGKKLRKLHTMENSSNWIVDVGYPITGSNVVEKVEYKDNRVYINEMQYFDNVQESAFNYYIGGYQPAQKWLKDRNGQKLVFKDIRHYQEIIYSLSETYKTISQFYGK